MTTIDYAARVNKPKPKYVEASGTYIVDHTAKISGVAIDKPSANATICSSLSKAICSSESADDCTKLCNIVLNSSLV